MHPALSIQDRQTGLCVSIDNRSIIHFHPSLKGEEEILAIWLLKVTLLHGTSLETRSGRQMFHCYNLEIWETHPDQTIQGQQTRSFHFNYQKRSQGAFLIQRLHSTSVL